MLDKFDLQLFGEAEDEVVDIVLDVINSDKRVNGADEVEVAKLAQMKRIADTLEQMQQSLECLLALTDCINHYNQFCITGTISNSEEY